MVRWLLTQLLLSLPPSRSMSPDPCVLFAAFFRCADDLWRGADLQHRGFPRAIRQLVGEPARSEDCPGARALALALTVHAMVWPALHYAEQLPPGLPRTTYHLELSAYAHSVAGEAFELAARHGVTSRRQLGDDPLAPALERLARAFQGIDGIRAASGGGGVWDTVAARLGWAGAPGELFLPIAQDERWQEAWLPVRPAGASAFWEVGSPPGEAQRLSALEAALKSCLFQTLDVLDAAIEAGVARSYWPYASTLLSFVRHGRLFGVFMDRQLDCVGDDLDLKVLLPPGGWARFVDDVSQRMRRLGFACYVGAPPANASAMSVRFEQLLCFGTQDGALCPVSFFRADGSAPDLDGPPCLAYDRPIRCPRSAIQDLVARYGGCPAVPRIGIASLTAGNDCVAWMAAGLSERHVADLVQRAEALDEAGFASFHHLWRSPLCSELPLRADGSLSVGEALGDALAEQHGVVRTMRVDACEPAPPLAETQQQYCSQRAAIALEMAMEQRGASGGPLWALMVDSSMRCCAPGPSVLSTGVTDGTAWVVSCFGPDVGRPNARDCLGLYDLERLAAMCPEAPQVLMLDTIPLAVGDEAAGAAVASCLPSGPIVFGGVSAATVEHLAASVPLQRQADVPELVGWSVWKVQRPPSSIG